MARVASAALKASSNNQSRLAGDSSNGSSI
jgi:hypothetical protein